MEQQGTVINRTFVLLNFRSIILAPIIYQSYHEIFVEFNFCHHIYNIYIYISPQTTNPGVKGPYSV